MRELILGMGLAVLCAPLFGPSAQAQDTPPSRLNILRLPGAEPADPQRAGAINTLLGLAPDANPTVMCVHDRSGAPSDCSYDLPDEGRGALIPPEIVVELRETGLIPGLGLALPAAETPPSEEPPGKVIFTSPLTNSVLRD